MNHEVKGQGEGREERRFNLVLTLACMMLLGDIVY